MAPGSVSDLVKRLRSCLSARAEILDAYLFGSQARGVAAEHSDLDVAVYLDEALRTRGRPKGGSRG